MSKYIDQEYLLTEQYQNAANLNARIQLHARFSTNTYDWHHWLFDYLQLPEKCRILELGCGPASLWQKNLQRIPAGWAITLTDFSPGMLQEAQHNLRSSSHAFSFARVDAQSIPFEEESFDAVIANHMLYHVPDRAKAFAEIRRVLKPGGYFYASTVGREHLHELDELIIRYGISQSSAFTKPDFVLENGAEELSRSFSHVKLHLYEDSLVITEAEPLIDYVLSTSSKRVLVTDKLEDFRKFVEAELAQQGAIRVTKASGLFEARKHSHTTAEQQAQSPLHLAPALHNLASSPTLSINEAVAKRRATGRETIHLGFGEATFPLHPLLHTAIANASKHTGYAPVAGIPALRQAIAEYLAHTRGLTSTPEQIIVGPGSKPLLYALLHILEGDLLLPVPSWVSYAPQARLVGKRVIGVPTDPSDHHRLAPQALSEAFALARKAGANPRILIVNTPSNPTGGMFAAADVEALALWAREMGVTIISDEIYAELAHGWREHISPARFYPEGCIVTGGLSKAFSAGGWRLGYAALPTNAQGTQAMSALRALASELWSAAATPIQEAAVVAFTPNAELEAYVRRSACIHGHVILRLYATLTGLEIPCPRPAGAFYLYPDFAPWRAVLKERGIHTSQELAHYLLDEWDIATLPGTAFGEEPEALRLRLATSMLYSPAGMTSPDEREAALWRLLALADTLPSAAQADGTALPLPALERAQARLTELISYLKGL